MMTEKIAADIAAFKRERNALLLEGDIDKMWEFMKKNSGDTLPEPSSRLVLEIVFHKARLAVTEMPMILRSESKRWLLDRNFELTDDGDVPPKHVTQGAATMPTFKHDGRRLFHKDYRMLSFVPRWSIAPRLHQQSDAEHSFFVTLYASQLCDFFNVGSQEAVMIVGWALRHDAYEIWTGDSPGPAKRYFIDEEKLEDYIDRFAEQVEDFKGYRNYIYGRDTLNLTWYTEFRKKAIRIIKVADLIDECFYLRYELAMGNVLVKDIFNLSYDRLREKCAEWGEETAEYLMRCVQFELSKIETEGALIPALK